MRPAARRAPLPALVAAVAAVLALPPAVASLRDADVFWRVRLGDLVLSTHRVPSREPWNFPVRGRPLAPTAWLGDVSLAVAHRAGGWGGVMWWRLLLSLALLALLARLVPPVTAATAVVFSVTALELGSSFAERPSLLSLCLLTALLPSLLGDRLPHPLAAGGLGWLWASLHGLWVLLPGLLLLRALVPGNRRRALLGAAAALVGAAVTPVGPRLLAQPFVYSRAARDLLEWRPVPLWNLIALPVLLLAAVAVAPWVRARKAPLADAVWVVAAVAGGLSAGRNVAVALLMLAPFAARSLRLPEVRGTVPLAAFGAVGVAGTALLVTVAVVTPTFPRGTPVRLVALLAREPGEVRVLNAYNTGGYVTGMGGPRVHAAIDGRLDPYPDGFVHRYIVTLRGDRDWAPLVDELRPTHALVEADTPVASGLRERGWRLLGEEKPYILLAAP